MHNRISIAQIVIVISWIPLFVLGTVLSANCEEPDELYEGNTTSLYEEIVYVFRSIADEEVAATTPDFCQDAPFAVDAMGGFSLYSIATRGKDGLLVNWAIKKIGEVQTCLKRSPAITSIHLRFTLGKNGQTVMIASGRCRIETGWSPEPGMFQTSCVAPIVDAAPEYVGGLLTTNTIDSLFSEDWEAERGYHPTSIGTIRIFKERRR